MTTYRCFTCGCSVKLGPHEYTGQHIGKYDITACSVCWASNWDGWGPFEEKEILAHLEARGIKVPARNANGFLPRD